MKVLHDYDIMILAGFIFGLDHDDEGVFERTLRFCERNRIELPSFFILTPLPGTPVFQRMESEGRLLHRDWAKYNGATVVFKPKLMTEETLQLGFNWVCKEAYSWGSILKESSIPNNDSLRDFSPISPIEALHRGRRKASSQAFPGFYRG